MQSQSKIKRWTTKPFEKKRDGFHGRPKKYDYIKASWTVGAKITQMVKITISHCKLGVTRIYWYLLLVERTDAVYKYLKYFVYQSNSISFEMKKTSIVVDRFLAEMEKLVSRIKIL